MNFLVSFVGAIGHLMTETDPEDIIKNAFGSFPKILTGKKFPQNVRALRIVTEEVLRKLVETAACIDELMADLESKALRSKTTKL